MDDASRTVTAFLAAVLAARDPFGDVYCFYMDRNEKVSGYPTYGPKWSADGTLTYDFHVTGADGRTYCVAATLHHRPARWVVAADVCVLETDHYDAWVPLREWPEREADDWPTAIRLWREAMAFLPTCAEVIPRASDLDRPAPGPA